LALYSFSRVHDEYFFLLQFLDDKEDKKEEKTEKIVTATKKGCAVLDQYLPRHIESSYHVLQVVCSFPWEIFDGLPFSLYQSSYKTRNK
jgi:hypothetical protein